MTGYLHPKFVDHAVALGAVCIQWSHLEWFSNFLLRRFLEISDDTVFETLANNIDFREKLSILIGLGFLKKPNDEWFAIFKASIDRIDNDLRARRNRVVHDRWGITAEGIKKIQTQTGIKRPQAFKTEYYTQTEMFMSADEIWALSDEIMHMIARIMILLFSQAEARLLPHLEAMLAEFAPLPPQVKLSAAPSPGGDGATTR